MRPPQRPSGSRQLLGFVVAWVVVSLSACTAILGIDDREEISPPSATGGGGGATGSSSSSGGSGAVGGVGAQGGAGGQAQGGGGAGAGCASDDDCVGSVEGSVCDVATGACVECIAGQTACAAGLYCHVDKTCEPGCDSDDDCNLGGGTLVCEAATHTCMGCTLDDQCPPGLLCDPASTACVPGCTEAHACHAAHECCGGECANLQVDETHCGLCTTVCQVSGAEPRCNAGACTWDTCLDGFGDCNGGKGDGCEVDLGTSTNHCGACGDPCAPPNATGLCVGGGCGIAACEQGYADCDGFDANGCEVDVLGDIDHCGGCGLACETINGVPTCDAGVCTIACASGFGNCDGNPANGCEIDTSGSVQHCGACGNACAAIGGTPNCVAGTCGISNCPPGLGDCDGNSANECETPLDTIDHCGACGVACAPPHAAGLGCAGGVCDFTGCEAGWGDCDATDANGCEENIATSQQHCGACATVCAPAHATGACLSGACTVAACNEGWGNCDNNAGNGCETNLQSDVGSCGSCGAGCSYPHAEASCAGGECQMGACEPGWGNCNGSSTDGCETPLGTTANCGGCGVACNLPNANATCSVGQCAVASCDAPYANCNGQPADGCEVNTTNNVNHCGGCNVACPSSGGIPNCVNGMCGFSMCPAGSADCDANGSCETNTTNNASHCGGCGNACTVANGVGACSSSTCMVASCTAPFKNCDGQYGNGCEVNSDTNPAHCGNCGQACSTNHASPSCAQGVCSVTCVGPWGNCDNNVGNGCEASLQSTTHCTACGNMCGTQNGMAVCGASGCQINCNYGWLDCDGSNASGCELSCVPLNATPPPYCAGFTAGTCGFDCNYGYQDCDGAGANGCETFTDNDIANCGYCGNICAGAQVDCNWGYCTCLVGWGDCDGIAGCETALGTNQNCKHCGDACVPINATSGSCQGLGCQFQCKASYANCNGYGDDGCEAHLPSDPYNCGGCGLYCPSGMCSNGTCEGPVITGSSTNGSSSSSGPSLP